MKELTDAGFKIDHQYKYFSTREQVWKHTDNASSYNKRMHATFDAIFELEGRCRPDGIVLVVAHASTVDLATGYFAFPRRKLMEKDLFHISDRIPYCTTAVFLRRDDSSTGFFGTWQFEGERALPPITYNNFSSRPNYKFLLRKTISDNLMYV